MSDRLSPPILSYDDLRPRAGDFLRTHHPAGTIPVPIEEIIEFQLGMDIIPVSGLHDAFGVDGFIAGDLRSITVDEFVYRAGLSVLIADERRHSILLMLE